MIIQTIDNISFNLKESHDFSFLSQYGKVFCVFDRTGSGCISFGTNDGERKYFIKVAGAKTIHAYIEHIEAIQVLKNAVPMYKELKHTNLIDLIDHYMLDDLYVAIFKWTDGGCLFDYWNFEKYAKNSLLSPRERFKQLPVQKKLNSCHAIFEFLSIVEDRGYVAVDFYDGSILYNFVNDVTTICDIDFFRKNPVYNDIGSCFFGTKRLKAPEEYILNAKIDSATNVFTVGALLFHFFGHYTDDDIAQMYKNNNFFPCELANWDLNKHLFEIALKAVNPNRENRYNSMRDFFRCWNEAIE